MMGILKPFHLKGRFEKLTIGAIDKFGLKEEQVHTGHLMLEALQEDPEYVHQIDAATDERHTNLEVAALSCKLADAMQKSGLKTGDHVVIMAPNNIWLTLPYYACHYNGYPSCAVDPCTSPRELESIFLNVCPKMVFSSAISENAVRKILTTNELNSRVIVYQGPYNINTFIEEFKGSEKGFRPVTFNKNETVAWLGLTGGTTGMPKVVVVTHDALLKCAMEWWKDILFVVERIFVLASLQWITSLIYFTLTPIIGYTRIQTSAVVTISHIREIIIKYKPQVTTFGTYQLCRFIQEVDTCDMSSVIILSIVGGAVDNDILHKLKEKYYAYIHYVYGMTELLTSPFRHVHNTPLSSVGIGLPNYSYKLVDVSGNEKSEPNTVGELWLKGGVTFKEYLNNPEETAKTLTPDGWLKTGDLFSRDENNFYYFYERKKLLIKYNVRHVAPLEIEGIIKQHPKVSEALVVGIPDPECMELPAAAVMTKDGEALDPNEIFALVNTELPVYKRLHGGLFFVSKFPLTAVGKINRPAVLKIALQVERTMDPNVLN